ncbi:MAG: IclR family transcriptional regulator, partial [Boseongicola sp. SB0664_bin_43]|nr:IclR family transcriptional regulator [Boseongicola sp. SB0664_bin_43]
DGEFAEGVRCVARPVFDSRDRMIAALGISGPSVRIGDSRLVELGQVVRKAGNPFLKDRP